MAVILALASGLLLGSIGTLVPGVAQTTSDTNATNATDGNITGNPLSNVPIIGDILGGK